MPRALNRDVWLSLESQPFAQTHWPFPERRSGRDLSWTQNALTTLLVEQPFYAVSDYDPPRRRSVDLSWSQNLQESTLGLDAPFGAPEQPNPWRRLSTVHLTWFNRPIWLTASPSTLHQSTQTQWLPERRSGRDLSWSQNALTTLLPVAQPFPPQGMWQASRRPSPADPVWIQGLLQSTLEPSSPISPVDFPVVRRRPWQDITLPPNLLVTTLGGVQAVPFTPPDLPNPRPRPRSTAHLIWFNSPILPAEEYLFREALVGIPPKRRQAQAPWQPENIALTMLFPPPPVVKPPTGGRPGKYKPPRPQPAPRLKAPPVLEVPEVPAPIAPTIVTAEVVFGFEVAIEADVSFDLVTHADIDFVITTEVDASLDIHVLGTTELAFETPPQDSSVDLTTTTRASEFAVESEGQGYGDLWTERPISDDELAAVMAAVRRKPKG